LGSESLAEAGGPDNLDFALAVGPNTAALSEPGNQDFATIIGGARRCYSTVTLIEMCSGSVVFGDMAMEQSGAVGVSGGSVGFGNLAPDRKALSHLDSPSA
jgi:hypothetical protein